MPKIIDSRGDTDFVWLEDIHYEESTLIAFYQNEQGFASFIAGASIVGEHKPVCRVLSKLHQVEAMNTIPAPIIPEWRIYEMYNEDGRRYFILRINHAYIPSSTQNKAWLYNYPVFRDIVSVLSEKGVNELVYLTANIMQDFIFSDQVQIPSDELIVYDYDEKDDALHFTDGTVMAMTELPIPPPSWILCSAFENFCTNSIRGNWLVIAANTNTTFINEAEADRLIEYLRDTHALLHNEMYKAELLEVLYEAEGEMV